MTTKEIADALGKPSRTVHDWITKVSAKVAQAKATSKPADYSLDETIEIIREGLGDAAAGVFAANAKAATTKPTLPSGVQMNAMIKMVDKGYLGRVRLQTLLGLIPETTKKELPSPIEGTLSKDEFAAVMAIRGCRSDKAKRDELTPRLM